MGWQAKSILKSFLSPFGRVPRWKYWVALGIYVAGQVPLVGMLQDFMNSRGTDPQLVPGSHQLTIGLICLVLGWYILVVATINRLHDMGRSGFLVLWFLVPGFLATMAVTWIRIAPSTLSLSAEAARASIVVVQIAAQGITLIVFVWLTSLCAFIRGDDWENRFGRPPREQ